jgi:hypothetical protein
VDLAKDARLARELARAGVELAGSLVTIGTDLLEQAIHSDWKRLIDEVELRPGDPIPMRARGDRDLGGGRILEALPGDKFVVAPLSPEEPFLELSRADLAEGLVAERLVLHETALDMVEHPDRTKWNYGYTSRMPDDDRAQERAEALAARGFPLPVSPRSVGFALHLYGTLRSVVEQAALGIRFEDAPSIFANVPLVHESVALDPAPLGDGRFATPELTLDEALQRAQTRGVVDAMTGDVEGMAESSIPP